MQERLLDKIKGLVFGQAIGDALGLGTEFMTKAQIKVFYPKGYNDYEQIYQDKHRSRWTKGDWTDDTDQMLCILDSILEKQEIDYRDVAKKIHHWAYNGGKGIGTTVYSVLTNTVFLQSPHEVAEWVWLQGKKQVAANGAIMRTSILGVWEYNDFEKVRTNTENVAKITHFDPRCVGSCIAVTFAISQMLRGEADTEKICEFSKAESELYDSRIAEYLEMAKNKDVEILELDEVKSIGYTLKALGAGFWALRQDSFENAMLKIVHEGGDADTNGAVAGSLLGTKLGFSHLPKKWIDGLNRKDLLEKKVQDLCELIQNIQK